MNLNIERKSEQERRGTSQKYRIELEIYRSAAIDVEANISDGLSSDFLLSDPTMSSAEQ